MREQFVVILESLPAEPGKPPLPPVDVRLRQLLKIALRGLKLRAVDVREGPW
jgi:hypothetical protein